MPERVLSCVGPISGRNVLTRSANVAGESSVCSECLDTAQIASCASGVAAVEDDGKIIRPGSNRIDQNVHLNIIEKVDPLPVMWHQRFVPHLTACPELFVAMTGVVDQHSIGLIHLRPSQGC